MRKNLKFVSAAAAALLTVAPVVATGLTQVSSVVSADTEVKGVPYFVNTDKRVVITGSVDFGKAGGTNSVYALVKKINAAYPARLDSSKLVDADTTTAVYTALRDAGVTVKSNGSFTVPATSFVVNVKATAANGQVATLPVTVNVTSSGISVDNSANPVITYGTQTYNSNKAVDLSATDKDKFGNVAVNGTVDKDAIAKEFTAQFSTNNTDKLDITVDVSKVNSAVVGTYPVTVSAKNPNGYTTSLTFSVNVGDKDATYKFTNASTPVVTINGNTVNSTTQTLNSGTQVATYGQVNVNGTDYTRLKDPNTFVESKYLSDAKPVAETGVDKTVMHIAAVYDKNGKATSAAELRAYNTVSVVSDPVTINGARFYKIANQDQYIKVGNIDGTSRSLKKNAYVYKSNGKTVYTYKSGKKTKKTVKEAGSSLTTYGSSFNINGKAFYRVGKNQYIKVANF